MRPLTARVLAAVATLLAMENGVKAQDSLTDRVGLQNGIYVLVGADLTSAAIGLAQKTELTIVIESPDSDDVRKARQQLDAGKLLGSRVYVRLLEDRRLSLANNLAGVVYVKSLNDTLPDQGELLRVVHPRGRLLLGDEVIVKPVPAGAGDWTHPYHGADNNPLAEDAIARAPYLTKFLAAPYYGPMPEITLSAGGRLFKAFGHLAFKEREWPMVGQLVAMNAYSGAIEWQRDMSPGFMIHRNTIIATADTLYLADHLSLKLIDTATGEIREEITIPETVVTDGPVWKWMNITDGVLYALLGEEEQLHTVHRGTRGERGWPWTTVKKTYGDAAKSWGFGRTVLSMDLKTREINWVRQEEDPIDSRAMSMSGDRLFIYSHEKFLAALNADDGKDVWRTDSAAILKAIGAHDPADNPRLGYSTSSYMKSTPEALFFAGPQRRKLVTVSAETGQLLWSYPDGNMQLIIRNDGLYAMGRMETSKQFDPLTGEILADLQCFRGNCTRATGTADSIFTRGYRHTGTMRFDVTTSQPQRLPAMRPACQDGVLAANGQLYWGPWMCDCNHSLVGVISLASAGKFDFFQPASDAQNLKPGTSNGESRRHIKADDRDWPTYRRDNRRSASTQVDVPTQVKIGWHYQARRDITPTPAIAVSGLVCFSGTDGIIRALDAKTGEHRWSAYTDGRVYYSPTFGDGLIYAGSADGYVYAFESGSGAEAWRFRAAPVERRIPVYGQLSSTWPVGSGVLVEDGIAYAAAGIACHDGTHVYALNADTGNIVWQNNKSSNLGGDNDLSGVSVQGHLLLHDGRIYMAGGNVVSPATYDAATGECLNKLTGASPQPSEKPEEPVSLDKHWQMHRSSRGSELFLSGNGVTAGGRMLYSQKQDGIASRYNANYALQADRPGLVIRGNAQMIQRVDPSNKTSQGKPNVIWQRNWFATTDAIVTAGNAVVVAGLIPDTSQDRDIVPAILALNIDDGAVLWSHRLPERVIKWGLAVDRDGAVLVSLSNGDLVRLVAAE